MSFAPELALLTVGKKQYREYVKAGVCAICVIVLVCINSLHRWKFLHNKISVYVIKMAIYNADLLLCVVAECHSCICT